MAVGLNGSPFNPDYALMRWTDTESDALESVRHIGFTGTSGSYLDYGLNCVLLDTTPNPFTGERGSLDRRAWQSIYPLQDVPSLSVCLKTKVPHDYSRTSLN